MGTTSTDIFPAICVLLASPLSAVVEVEVNVNVRHTVGEVSTFDRSKFITIHSSHTDREWTDFYRGEDNFTDDLLADFILGNDVYFGRDTGYISYYLRNLVGEDPSNQGWARLSGSPDSITNVGANARSAYDLRSSIHPYASRNEGVMAAQYTTFWPDGTPTNKGWAFSQTNTAAEPLGSATGAFMGDFLNHFYASDSQSGPPLPAMVEVMNEPDWPLLDNGDTPASTVWEFHNSVADHIRARNENVLIGGYCTTFPDLEENNFREWQDEWRLFIDLCGANMDFYSLHLYDFPVFGQGGNVQWWRKGSNLEATLDMIEHYSILKTGRALPFVISEYGASTHALINDEWSPWRDWLKVKSINAMLMSFMDRPNMMLKTIPFIICKAEWGRTAVPYSNRLMRQANEPDSHTGEWVYTDMVKFYQLWSDIRGTRIDIRSSEPDIQTDAYVDGNKVYVILNNLNATQETIALSLFENQENQIDFVHEKRLFWNGADVSLEDTAHPEGIDTVQLLPEATSILVWTFRNPILIEEDSMEVKHYAKTYFQPITGDQTIPFEIDGVTKGHFGEGILRLGMGRRHTKSKQPAVTINGFPLEVPTDFMGHEGDDRDHFFGALDIPVPYSVLRETNQVTVTFPDSGGYVSSLALRAFNFSENVRRETWSPQITSVKTGDGNVLFEFKDGPPLGAFELIATDELSRAVDDWDIEVPNLSFDINGQATTISPMGQNLRRFYRMRQKTVSSPAK